MKLRGSTCIYTTMIYYLAEKTTLHASFHNCVEVFVSHEWNLSWWKFDLFCLYVSSLYEITRRIFREIIPIQMYSSKWIQIHENIKNNILNNYFSVGHYRNLLKLIKIFPFSHALTQQKSILFLSMLWNETKQKEKESWHFHWFIGCISDYPLHVKGSQNLFND